MRSARPTDLYKFLVTPGLRARRLGRAGVLAAALLMACGAPHAGAQDAAPATPLVSNAVAVSGDNQRVTLSFTVSGDMTARAFVMENPDRVIVELPEVNFQIPAEQGRGGRSFVSSFRYGLFARGRSRIIIDLKEPAVVTRAVVATPEGALPRLEIELQRVDRERFHREAREALAAGSAAPPDSARAEAATAGDRRPVIVLDPGHGGVDNGAVSSTGLVEKDVVLAFTRRLRELLEASGRYQVRLTRDDDVFVPLGERVRIAQGHKAALFLSIHADILRESPNVRGATVYTGSKFATDAESAQLADKENQADSAAGVESEAPADQVADILRDLTMRETRTFSTSFADRVVRSLGEVIKLNKNPHRSAGFIVLTSPETPSALLEIGYLSSARDADLMMSPEWRDRTAGALTAAINRYFDERGAAFSPNGARRP